MKVYHFILIFLFFFMAAVVSTDLSIGKLKAAENEKKELIESLNSSTSDAIKCLAASGYYGTNTVKKDDVVNTFFNSFYSAMGIISNTNKQKEFEMYIPVILLCDLDGYYIYYYDEYKAGDGYSYFERIWSEKMPFYYKDKDFIYRFTLTNTVYLYDVNHLLSSTQPVIEVDYREIQKNDAYAMFRASHGDSILLNDEAFELARKSAMISQLENTLSYYTTRHNSIAKSNGITYTFAFPSGGSEEWAEYLDDVSLLVVFQGYPYGKNKDYTYNKVASAGANLIKKSNYYVEKKSWYYLAHLVDCSKRKDSTTVLEETFDTLEECAQLGAYCCQCIEKGSRVPALK